MPIKQDHGPQLNQVGPESARTRELHFTSEVITPDFDRARAIVDVDPVSRLIIRENGDLVFQDLRVSNSILPDYAFQSEFRERRQNKLLAPEEELVVVNLNEAMVDPDKLSSGYCMDDLVALERQQQPSPAESRRLNKYYTIGHQEVNPIILAADLGLLGRVLGRGEGHGDVQVFGQTRFQVSDRANIQVKILPPFSEFFSPAKKAKSIDKLANQIKETPNGGILFIPTKSVTSEMCHCLKQELCRFGLDPLQIVFLSNEALEINGYASFDEVTYGDTPGLKMVYNTRDRKLLWAQQMQQNGSLERVHSDLELSAMISDQSKKRISELEDYLRLNYKLAHEINT